MDLRPTYFMMPDSEIFDVPRFLFFSDTTVGGASPSKQSRLGVELDQWLIWGSVRFLWYA